ncbi:hypothetical protein GRI97_08470 [Altererythrobacter xixiisoli]|uniref:Uncharacterized protein n=1 Tax=Croceibacterium xixiisoli TaxID=1476466 RepID=A0A6I4TUZ0_9SPHN|nr:YdbH domain-containing protein [Croceibacterium xixiisoli]MXO99021.1 hypothetical protein [Croceibacterium xixiisoli]
MADEAQDIPAAGKARLGVGCWAFFVVLALMLAAGLAGWLNRERIAGNFISDALADAGLQASYTVEEIGPERQVLTNIVIGRPDRPDLTIERLEVGITPRFGIPDVEKVRVVRPRLFGTYVKGKLSFGALDPLIFTDSEDPFALPDLIVAVEDGRGLMETDHGPIGFRIQGDGNLRNGFTSEIAATAPRLALGSCSAIGVTLYGELSIRHEKPRFAGPLRSDQAACASAGIQLGKGATQLTLVADKDLAGVEGSANLQLASLSANAGGAQTISGDAHFTWREAALTARYDLGGVSIRTPHGRLASLTGEGTIRARRQFERIEWEGSIAGEGLQTSPDFDRAMAQLADAGADTLVAPLVQQLRTQIARQIDNGRITAGFTARRTGPRMSVVLPSVAVVGGQGGALLGLSRVQLSLNDAGALRLSGNLATGGENLPRIVGYAEQGEGGDIMMRLSMAPYSAGDARLAMPELLVRQGPNGMVGFSGRVEASGPLPGGYARMLQLPLSGNWSKAGGLALWRECTTVRFDGLQIAQLSLERRSLQLCPQGGRPILAYGSRGMQLAAGAPSLDLRGRLGETPIALRTGAVGFAWPGAMTARQVDVALGPVDAPTSFVIEDLRAQLGKDIGGRFAGAEVRLAAVPLDLLGAGGSWRYADGRLSLTEGVFRVEDRAETDRFEPVIARDAVLELADNRITAQALLREPRGDTPLARLDIAHNLADTTGHADIRMDGLTFTPGLQPLHLTPLARGVVANVRGTVDGRGRIDWNPAAITSSGQFHTNSLDLAAAFGGVKGIEGTIHFTDLLGMTTAPAQEVRIASVNPGIEVNDGTLRYSLRGGEVLTIEHGQWPFMGGTLVMKPVTLRFGAAEVRRYVFDIEGLEAARFVEHMQMGNIGATGVFDGTIPVVFDAAGNGSLQGGLLISRAPGGNVSYVGELTYKDLSAMANFAFDTLRSLDYRQMSIAMDGSLSGEIVTRVRFDGVRQGQGTRQNFITRRIANLPIRFDVNIRAPFYSLMTSIKALYDPAAIRDPREVGLLDSSGNRTPASLGRSPIGSAGRTNTPIQHSESENEQ